MIRAPQRAYSGALCSSRAAPLAALRPPGRVVEEANTPPRADDYVRQQGLRLVKPYFFDFICSCKDRWKGLTVIDVLAEEFPARPRRYYEEAFADGRIRVEKRANVTAATPLDGRERLRHFVHRHEPPVLDLPVQVLGETTDLVAVSKPASMPVHVAGQYRKNTVLALLQLERPDLGSIHPVHRLDKPVSGLLLFARSAAAAERVRTQLAERVGVEKVYLARVLGAFPSQPCYVDAPLAWDARSNQSFVPEGSAAPVQRPGKPVQRPSDEVLSDKDLERRRQLPGKAALTDFKLLAVAPDGLTSIVECRPRTGRTHQIRVHLQHLGHPIANDAQYGGTYKGPEQVKLRGRGQQAPHGQREPALQPAAGSNGPAAAQEPAAKRQRQGHGDGAEPAGALQPGMATEAGRPEGAADSAVLEAQGTAGVDPSCLLVPPELHDELCWACPYLIPDGYPTDIVPLWLHAQAYSSSSWSFTCPAPLWANTNWLPPAPVSNQSGQKPV